VNKDLIGRRCILKDSGTTKAWRIAGYNLSGDVILEYNGIADLTVKPSRIELLPVAATRAAENYGVSLDPMRVTHDEATELLTHMLGLAHMYFQASPDDARDEVIRIIAQREGPSLDGAVMVGALAAYDAWFDHYETLRREDEE